MLDANMVVITFAVLIIWNIILTFRIYVLEHKIK